MIPTDSGPQPLDLQTDEGSNREGDVVHRALTWLLRPNGGWPSVSGMTLPLKNYMHPISALCTYQKKLSRYSICNLFRLLCSRYRKSRESHRHLGNALPHVTETVDGPAGDGAASRCAAHLELRRVGDRGTPLPGNGVPLVPLGCSGRVPGGGQLPCGIRGARGSFRFFDASYRELEGNSFMRERGG